MQNVMTHPVRQRRLPATRPPGGGAPTQKNEMKMSAFCETVRETTTKHRKADGMKCSKSRSHLTDEDRFLIEKSWNIPDGRRHPSVRAIAKSLGLAEATLRRELKRGCADGKYCMVLNDKGKRRWQYFLYSAEAAILDARWQASAKGPRIKLTTSHISTIRKYLKEWPSIPSAYEAMLNDNLNESFPSLRTFQYHAQKGYWSARVNRRDLYNPHGRRPKHSPPRTAGNHNPTHRIDDLPEEVRKYRVKGYAQMDTIHSGARGKDGLLTMILPADGHKAFVRKLRDLRQEIVHRALRSIARECRRLGIKITHILTDNGSEFLDEKTIGQIFRLRRMGERRRREPQPPTPTSPRQRHRLFDRQRPQNRPHRSPRQPHLPYHFPERPLRQ